MTIFRNMNIIRQFTHFFFPALCPSCGKKLLPSEQGVCLECIANLPRTNNFRERDNAAETLMAGRIPFERIASFCVFTKGGVLPPLIHALKYRQGKNIGLLLGKLYGKDLKNSEFILPVHQIVPVPLHPKKEKERGYNQAEIIANGLSESLSLPVSTGNLIRSIHNPTQTKRSRTQRWDNVKNIFEVKNPAAFAGKHILLVDDVITTGSTLEACGVALQKCPSIKISIATLGEVF